MGFTDLNDLPGIEKCKTYEEWYNEKVKFFNSNNKKARFASNVFTEEFSSQINYLGLRNNERIAAPFTSSASILQYLLETKLSMQQLDKDMIVMVHEIGYRKQGKNERVVSSMIVKGNDQGHTAMAKTVGLPLGIAAKLIMQRKIISAGLHIPVSPEIYGPVLTELENHSIKFVEETSIV